MRNLLYFGAALLLIASAFGQTVESRPPSQVSQQTAAGGASTAKIDPAKEADIRRMFEIVGTRKLVSEMMTGMEGNIKPLMT